MEEALQIHLVLENILEKVDLRTLKACRLVNKDWKYISSGQIMKQNLCQINFIFHNNTYRRHHPSRCQCSRSNFPKIMKNAPHSQNLSFLIPLLEKSFNFPCQNFTFQSGNFVDPILQNFLQTFGHQLKYLQLIRVSETIIFYKNVQTSSHSFLKLIQEWAPFLICLKISGYNYELIKSPGEESGILRYLKKLCFENESLECGLAILKIAPNLTTLNLSCCNGDWVTSSFDQVLYPNVKILEISDAIENFEMLPKLLSFFPHFTHLILHIQSEGNLVNLLPKIFEIWPHLEKLELWVKNQLPIFYLDAILTGLSFPDCEILRNSLNEGQVKDLYLVRGQPSLTDLTELKSLKIFLEYSSYKKNSENRKIPLTILSCLYAFKPKVKVSILFDPSWLDTGGSEGFKTQLGVLEPYVNFVMQKF